jgi:hypothetical protein
VFAKRYETGTGVLAGCSGSGGASKRPLAGGLRYGETQLNDRLGKISSLFGSWGYGVLNFHGLLSEAAAE